MGFTSAGDIGDGWGSYIGRYWHRPGVSSRYGVLEILLTTGSLAASRYGCVGDTGDGRNLIVVC